MFTDHEKSELVHALAERFKADMELEAARLTMAAAPGLHCEDCGASLVHIDGAGIAALLCPQCDVDQVQSLVDRSDAE